MLIERPPNRMIAEKEREERARLQAEQDGSPRPVSTVGGGRAGALMSFTLGTSYGSGGR
jgi:hypothetical protein